MKTWSTGGALAGALADLVTNLLAAVDIDFHLRYWYSSRWSFADVIVSGYGRGVS